MTTEPVPAVILANLRRIARNAQRRGTRLDPTTILAIIEGKHRA